MYIADTIIKTGAVITALIAIVTMAYGVFKWYQRNEKQSADIKSLQDEICLISYAMLACLDGLEQLKCDGAVTKAHEKLEKFLNQRAHGQI